MTQNIEVEYSKFIGTPDENKTLECKIANDVQSGYVVDIGENVRLIKGIFGDILLCFQSDIGLQRIRSRGWGVKYGLDEFGQWSLLAIRPAGQKPLKDKDYEHLYSAWMPGSWGSNTKLIVYHNGIMYGVDHPSADNWLYLRRANQLQVA